MTLEKVRHTTKAHTEIQVSLPRTLHTADSKEIFHE